MKLLLVEDDPEICGMLKKFLEKENFEIITANDGKRPAANSGRKTCDLVLLDLMLPKISGMDVLQQIRAQSTVPIIIMSAKDTDSDITLGLGLGADDYVTKPFSMVQVLARIKANLRRTGQYAASSPARPSLLSVGELRMNLEDYTVSKQGKEIELTAKEFEILRLLLQNPRKVYTKEQIYSLIWNDAYFGDENAVNVHISRLRNKIEDNPRSPKYVITVWGIGYKSGEFK